MLWMISLTLTGMKLAWTGWSVLQFKDLGREEAVIILRHVTNNILILTQKKHIEISWWLLPYLLMTCSKTDTEFEKQMNFGLQYIFSWSIMVYWLAQVACDPKISGRAWVQPHPPRCLLFPWARNLSTILGTSWSQETDLRMTMTLWLIPYRSVTLTFMMVAVGKANGLNDTHVHVMQISVCRT